MMKKEELEEVMNLLIQAGMSPMVCDTLIHLSACPVRCGKPTLMGDDYDNEGILLPEALVGYNPEMFVPAKGDSMVEAGFDDGDLLRVKLTASARDGDIVVASIDGAATVKVLFTDGQGRRWLVPCNDRYDAILLGDNNDVRIYGVVTGFEKQVVRASSADCLKAISRTLAKHEEPPVITAEQIDSVIRAVAEQVTHARQWYAVYRAMADKKLVGEGRFREFCERVRHVVPGHEHLPVAKELGRLAVQSFRRRVPLWDADDAPVKGARFADYLHIAQFTAMRLTI